MRGWCFLDCAEAGRAPVNYCLREGCTNKIRAVPLLTSQNAMRNKSTGGFSLIELLSVLAILGVMLGILLPALSGFRSSYERKQAVGTVMGTLERARLAALQSGEDVHVIFARPTDSGSTDDAMIIVGDPPIGSALSGMVLHTRWIKLPKGVRFRGAADTLAVGGLPAGFNGSILPSIGGTPLYSAITFNSQGRVEYPAGGALDLALFEGYRDSGGAETAGEGSGKATQGLSDAGQYEVIRLSRFTGRARVDIGTLQVK